MSLGNLIKEARKLKSLTQSQLGSMLGVSTSSISEWESGKHKPDVDTIEKLAGILEQTPSYFLGERNYDLKELDVSTLELHNIIDKLNYDGKQRIKEYALDLLDNPKYTVDSDIIPNIPSLEEAIRLQQGTPYTTLNPGHDNIVHKAAFGGGVWKEKNK